MKLFDPDFEVAFALLEGEHCLARSLKVVDEYSIAGAREMFTRKVESYKSQLEMGLHEPGDTYLVCSIYGNGGLHRYHVEIPTGEVKFSAMHALPEGVKKAEALGLTTH
jgi:hypothetical protein